MASTKISYLRPRSRALLLNSASFVVLMAGISAAKSLVIPFLLALFLAIISTPAMLRLRKLGLPAWLAIIILVAVIIAIEVLVGTLIGTSVADFTRSIPLYQARLMERLDVLIAWLQSHGVQVTRDLLAEHFNPGKIMSMIANMMSRMGNLLTNTFLILITFAFIMLETAGFSKKIKAISRDGSSSLQRLGEISQAVNRYLAIKALTSMVTGVLIANMLRVVGVEYAFLWGLLAFLLNFVPTIGSIIAAVPALLLALVQFGLGKALLVALFYLIINIGISNLVEPKLLGERVGLSTLVVFMSMVFWGWILGPVGMLLSVPLTITFKIAMEGHDDTRWIAILLGTDHDAEKALSQMTEDRVQRAGGAGG